MYLDGYVSEFTDIYKEKKRNLELKQQKELGRRKTSAQFFYFTSVKYIFFQNHENAQHLQKNVLVLFAFQIWAQKGEIMAVYKTNVALTKIKYAESILRIVDDVIDDGENLTFYVPLEKQKKFLYIMSASGIWAKKC